MTISYYDRHYLLLPTLLHHPVHCRTTKTASGVLPSLTITSKCIGVDALDGENFGTTIFAPTHPSALLLNSESSPQNFLKTVYLPKSAVICSPRNTNTNNIAYTNSVFASRLSIVNCRCKRVRAHTHTHTPYPCQIQLFIKAVTNKIHLWKNCYV